MSRIIAAVFVTALTLAAPGAALASQDEDALTQGCDWLERAIAREPARDDAFGMFMRGMRPKCQAMLEGIARKDNSVKAETMRQIVKEIDELRQVIDAEHGGPPPAVSGPTPGEQARRKVEEEKAEAERVARDKAEAERLDKERAAAEKAAAERAEAERLAAQRAAEEAGKDEEREHTREVEADKKEAEADKKATEAERKAAEREERARVAADKKAAEEAKKAAEREERARIAADKKAAEEAKKAAEREERARVAADKKAAEEAKKAAEREARERAEREREEAREKAQQLVEAETLAEREAAKRAAEEAAKRAAEEAAKREAEARAKKPPTSKQPRSGIDGTWEQPAAKVLDRHVKRTLNLLTKDGKVQGELYEEVWFEAPSAWIDTSCGGNTTFRMVTTARVSGEVEGNGLELWRDPPRILTCTCASRCTVESRRRGMDLAIGASGAELRDATGVFVRPGTAVGVAPAAGDDNTRTTLAPGDFGGQWETAPFKRRDQTIVQRLDLVVDGAGKVSGELVERSSQGLPLASWAERFCDGATRWEWVTRWVIEGKVAGSKATLKARDGANLLCTCPSKCVAPKDKLTLEIVYGATGATLHHEDRTFQRR